LLLGAVYRGVRGRLRKHQRRWCLFLLQPARELPGDLSQGDQAACLLRAGRRGTNRVRLAREQSWRARPAPRPEGGRL